MNNIAAQITVKLPSCTIVPCVQCGQLHNQDTQKIYIGYIGNISYDACSASCEQIVLDRINYRLGASMRPRPQQFLLARKITDLQQEIEDLKQLIKEWHALVSELSTARTAVRHHVWLAERAELQERTQKMLQKEMK